MSVSGRFQADFQNFFDACQKAETSLKGFEQGSGKVETALNRMTNSFSGTKIIQDATIMSEAVQRVGGVSMLTEKELARVGATAAEAVEKMKKMGVDVPPGIANIATHAKSATSTFGDMKSVLGTLAGAFGITFGIGAIVQFGRSVLAAGDEIKKMADQTGLSVVEVQKLQYIAGQSGTSITSLVGAVQNLQQRLGDDSTGAAGAMRKLGISADDFNKLGTYEQMTTLGEAIKGIEDPTERASTAAALFGKTWKDILPAILAGMRDVGEAAPVMSAEAVKALDEAGDALTRLYQQSLVAGAGVVQDLVNMQRAYDDFGAKVKGTVTDADVLKGAFEAIPPVSAAVGAGFKGVGLTADDLKRVTAELTKENESAIKANEALATSLGKAEKAYAALMSEVNNKAGQAQMDAAAATMERAAKNAEGMWLQERDAWQLDFATKQAGLAQEAEAARVMEAAVTEAQKANDDWIKGMQQIPPHVDAATRSIAGMSITLESAIPKIYDWVSAYEKAGLVQTSLGAPGDWGASTRNQMSRYNDTLANIGTIPGFAGGVSNFSGGPAWVGERGPELLNLPAGSSITPMGGGSSIVVNITTMMGNPTEIARQVKAALIDAARSTGQRLPG